MLEKILFLLISIPQLTVKGGEKIREGTEASPTMKEYIGETGVTAGIGGTRIWTATGRVNEDSARRVSVREGLPKAPPRPWDL